MQPFFVRLANYYEQVAIVLRGESKTASIFPNSTDIGICREQVYADFLRAHAPRSCNIFFGGFLFDSNGRESQQIDVIVSSDNVARFDLHNRDGTRKSFAQVNGALAVASIKSTLDKKELLNALDGFASIPPTDTPTIASPLVQVPDYADWPYKILYASEGISLESLVDHLNAFYRDRTDIPYERRPNLVHVAGKYAVLRIKEGYAIHFGQGIEPLRPDVGYFQSIIRDADIQALVLVSHELQKKSNEASQIIFSRGTDVIVNFYNHRMREI